MTLNMGLGRAMKGVPYINTIDTILILGESIIAWGLPSVLLKSRLDSTFPNNGITIVNEAVPGATINDLVLNINTYLNAQTSANVFVFVHIGTNDISGSRPWDGTENAAWVSQYDTIRTAIETKGFSYMFSDILASNNFNSLVQDTLPFREDVGSLPFNTNIVNPYALLHSPEYTFADGTPISDFYLWAYNDYVSYLDTVDGVHFTDLGYDNMITQFINTVGKYLITGVKPTQLTKFDHNNMKMTHMIQSSVQGCLFTQGSTCIATSSYDATVINNTGVVSYLWTVTGATIQSGQGTASITVTTDADTDTTFSVSCDASDDVSTSGLSGNFTHAHFLTSDTWGTSLTIERDGVTNTYGFADTKHGAVVPTTMEGTKIHAMYSHWENIFDLWISPDGVNDVQLSALVNITLQVEGLFKNVPLVWNGQWYTVTDAEFYSYIVANTGNTLGFNILEIPASIPNAVTDLVATVGDASVSLAWSAPQANNSDIIDYSIEYKLTSEPTVWTPFVSNPITGTTAVVSGLINDSSYDFRVVARNNIGTSLPSNIDSAIPFAIVYEIQLTVADAHPTYGYNGTVGSVTPATIDGTAIAQMAAYIGNNFMMYFAGSAKVFNYSSFDLQIDGFARDVTVTHDGTWYSALNDAELYTFIQSKVGTTVGFNIINGVV